MKLYKSIVVFVFILGFLLASKMALATGYELNGTIDANTSVITFTSGAGTNAVSGGDVNTVFDSDYSRYHDLFPSTSNQIDSGSNNSPRCVCTPSC